MVKANFCLFSALFVCGIKAVLAPLSTARLADEQYIRPQRCHNALCIIFENTVLVKRHNSNYFCLTPNTDSNLILCRAFQLTVF